MERSSIERVEAWKKAFVEAEGAIRSAEVAYEKAEESYDVANVAMTFAETMYSTRGASVTDARNARRYAKSLWKKAIIKHRVAKGKREVAKRAMHESDKALEEIDPYDRVAAERLNQGDILELLERARML